MVLWKINQSLCPFLEKMQNNKEKKGNNYNY